MLVRVEFVPAQHGELLNGFHCGNEEWAVEVATWIQASETEDESAARQLERGHVDQVWLYFNDEKLIGFTSIGRQNWIVNENGDSTPIIYIPYLGVSSAFQGKKDLATGKSYFRSITIDLLKEAKARANREESLVGPHVQFGNLKGIGIYQSYGFAICGEEDGKYYRMIADVLSADL